MQIKIYLYNIYNFEYHDVECDIIPEICVRAKTFDAMPFAPSHSLLQCNTIQKKSYAYLNVFWRQAVENLQKQISPVIKQATIILSY